ncbi:MAG: TraR/DksA C4-type zinc finger protein [Mycobacteriales bacterium]
MVDRIAARSHARLLERKTGVDLDAQRKRLEERLAELDGSTSVLQGEHGDPGELSDYDQHPADSATNLSDTDREEAVLEIVNRERHAIVAALARLNAGSYGSCVECGAQLPDERLEARPEASRCVNCQQRYDRSR